MIEILLKTTFGGIGRMQICWDVEGLPAHCLRSGVVILESQLLAETAVDSGAAAVMVEKQ